MAFKSLLHRLVGGKEVAQQKDIAFAAGFAAQEIADDAGSFGFDMKVLVRR